MCDYLDFAYLQYAHNYSALPPARLLNDSASPLQADPAGLLAFVRGARAHLRWYARVDWLGSYAPQLRHFASAVAATSQHVGSSAARGVM